MGYIIYYDLEGNYVKAIPFLTGYTESSFSSIKYLPESDRYNGSVYIKQVSGSTIYWFYYFLVWYLRNNVFCYRILLNNQSFIVNKGSGYDGKYHFMTRYTTTLPPNSYILKIDKEGNILTSKNIKSGTDIKGSDSDIKYMYVAYKDRNGSKIEKYKLNDINTIRTIYNISWATLEIEDLCILDNSILITLWDSTNSRGYIKEIDLQGKIIRTVVQSAYRYKGITFNNKFIVVTI